MLFRSRNEVHSRFSPSTPVPAFEQSKPSSSSGKAGKSGDSSFLKQIHQLKNCINILTKCKLTILPRQLLQTIIYTSPHEKSATWNTIFDQKSQENLQVSFHHSTSGERQLQGQNHHQDIVFTMFHLKGNYAMFGLCRFT